MKKTTFILAALLSAACISAQETLTLEQCREMALKYNKEMAAAARQTESARYTAKSYKGNFFPNFSLSGIIPRMVVSAAMVTGRRRLWALSTSAVMGSTPWLS